MRRPALGLALLLGLAPLAPAQAPPRFQWSAGLALTYSVEQTTSVTEVTLDEKTKKPETGSSSTKLALTRRFTVKGVDAKGVATIEMAILSLKQQITRPGPADKDGKPTVDTVAVDSETPEGKATMGAYLNKPVLTIQVDALGKLIDAKSDNAASVARLQAELPFRVVLPEAAPAVGATWSRPFTVTLDPPLGAGEKVEATQTYTHKGVNGGFLVLGVASALKEEPKDAALMPALIPLLWEGEAFFQPATGRYAGARLTVKKEAAGHAGAGSKFTYESSYTEALAEK